VVLTSETLSYFSRPESFHPKEIISLPTSHVVRHRDDPDRVTFSIRHTTKCEANPHTDPLATPSSSIPSLSPKKSTRILTPSKANSNIVLREFQCSSLVELYEWLTILGCCVESVQFDEEVRYSGKKEPTQVGFRPRTLRKDLKTSPQKSIYYVNYTTRCAWTNLLNIENESPLLILLRFSNRYSQQCPEFTPLHLSLFASEDDSSSMRSPVTPLEVMHVWSWLVENGCRLSHQNSLGNTVLHYAIKYRYTEIIRGFLLMEHVRRSESLHSGDDINYWELRNNEGVSPAMMMLELEQEHLDLETNFSPLLIQLYGLWCQRKKEMEGYRQQLSILQAQKRRFSFLRIFFEKHFPPSRYGHS
jgi:hypothetical protein